MKVIQSGAKKNWWVGKKLTCQTCHAILLLEEGDPVREYKMNETIQIYVTCPECKKEARLYFS